MTKKSSKKSTVPSLRKTQFNRKVALLFAALFAVIGSIFIFQANAAPKNRPTPTEPAVTLYVSPASQRVKVGQNVTVNVLLNTNGEAVNALQANLTYPADKLEFVSVDNANGAFEIIAENTGGSGTVRIARGSYTPVISSSAQLGTITFKAIGSGRNVGVTFSADSQVIRASDAENILAKTIGGQYSIN